MSTSWTKKEDEQLINWMEKGLEKNWNLKYLRIFVSRKLGRPPEDCAQRWDFLKERITLEQRVNQLEELVKHQQAQIEKIKKDMRFYELMLLEEYHLLLKLLGEDRQNLQIQRL